MEAVKLNKYENVKLLLCHKSVNINVKNKKGKRAVDLVKTIKMKALLKP